MLHVEGVVVNVIEAVRKFARMYPSDLVFIEEVEDIIRRHPRVCDVVVIGTPDERLGEIVTGDTTPERRDAGRRGNKAFLRAAMAALQAPAADNTRRSSS